MSDDEQAGNHKEEEATPAPPPPPLPGRAKPPRPAPSAAEGAPPPMPPPGSGPFGPPAAPSETVFAIPGGHRPGPPPPPPYMGAPGELYPMRFEVAYPERLSRLSTAFRFVLIIPVAIFVQLLNSLVQFGIVLGFIPAFLKKRYPRWLFAANAGGLAFSARYLAYAMLLTDRYPSFDTDTSPVMLEYQPPIQGQISRWRVLFWKAILLIPQFLVLAFLWLAAGVIVFLAWFAIVFTGNYPRGMFGFVTGVLRWNFRVSGYFASFTDRYPPYSLSAEAGSAGQSTIVWNGIIGGILTAGFVASIAALAALLGATETRSVDYDNLTSARPRPEIVLLNDVDGDVVVALVQAHDPGDDLVAVMDPRRNERVIVFDWTLVGDDRSLKLGSDDARLQVDVDGRERWYTAEMMVAGGRTAPVTLAGGQTWTVRAVFVVPADAEPLVLTLRPEFVAATIRYEFD